MTTVTVYLDHCPLKNRFAILPRHPKGSIYRVIGKPVVNNEVTFVISRRGPNAAIAVSVFSSRDSAEEFFTQRVRGFSKELFFFNRHRVTLCDVVRSLRVHEVYPTTRPREEWSWVNLEQDAREGKIHSLLMRSEEYDLPCFVYDEEVFVMATAMRELELSAFDTLAQVNRRYMPGIWPILRSLMGMAKVPTVQLQTIKI